MKNNNAFDGLDDFAREPEKPLFTAITMPELMSGNYKVHYFCRGVLPMGQPAIMGAPHKCFKTSLALELSVSLATGAAFLNHFEVPEPIRIAYFLGEGGLHVAQDTLRRIGTAKDINIAAIDKLLMTDQVPRLDNMVHLAAVEDYLKEHRPDVCIFDPLYLAMSGADVTNVFSMGERLRNLNDVCMPLGVTPILLHHLKRGRGDQFAPAGLEDLSMAGCAEFAATWVLLSRRKAFDADDPTHRLWLSFGGRAGHGSAWGLDITEGTIDDPGGRVWQTDLRRQDDVRAEGVGREVARRQDREKVKNAEFEAMAHRSLAWATGQKKGFTKHVLQVWLRSGTNKTDQIIAYLQDNGRIESCTIEVKNNRGIRQVDGYRAILDGDNDTLFS